MLIFFVNILYGQEVTLYRVNVEGNATTSDKMIKYSAGLRDGTQIQRSDISTALTRLWDLGLFDDVNIVLNNDSEYGVEITIQVEESPTLNNILFEGISVRESRFTEKIDLKTLNSQWSKARKSFQNSINTLEERKVNEEAIFRRPLMGRVNMK